MSERNPVLLPENEIDEALADLRPDAAEFERGIADRIAARGDRETESRAAWPTWLKRAAGVLPPGVSELALFGKSASAKAGTSFLLGPAAAITLAVAGVIAAFRSTLRLDASETGTASGTSVIVGVLFFWITGFVVVFAGLKYSSAVTRAWVFGGLLIAAIVVATLMQSAARVASRERVGIMLERMLIQASLVVLAYTDDPTATLATALAAPLLAMSVVPIGLLQHGKARMRVVRNGVLATLVVTGIGVFGTTVAYGSPRGTSERELVEVAKRLEPRNGFFPWDRLGAIARGVDENALAGLDRERLRKTVEREIATGLSPEVASTAFRLGVLPTSAWDGQARRLDPRTHELVDVQPIRAGRPLRFEVLVLKRENLWNDAVREKLRQLIEESWPEPGSYRCVSIAAACIESADEIGAPDLVTDLGQRVPEVLASAWVGRRAPAGFAVGFESCTPELHPAKSSTNPFTTLEAVLLMRRFGVPDSIDLESLDRSLTFHMRTGNPDNPDSLAAWAAVARLVLRRDIGVPRATISQWLPRNLMLVFMIIGGALAVWATWRAPVADDGTLTARFEGTPL